MPNRLELTEPGILGTLRFFRGFAGGLIASVPNGLGACGGGAYCYIYSNKYVGKPCARGIGPACRLAQLESRRRRPSPLPEPEGTLIADYQKEPTPPAGALTADGLLPIDVSTLGPPFRKENRSLAALPGACALERMADRMPHKLPMLDFAIAC